MYNGIIYSEPDPRIDFQKKVQAAMQSYRSKFGTSPKKIIIHPCNNVDVPGVEIEHKRYIQPYDVFVTA
jgi:hypothetical protein